MLKHGGRLLEAAQQYNIPVPDWLDLSTGINPTHWPLQEIPAACFTRLPEENDGLRDVAQHYYQTTNLLAVAGSQQVIQLLPHLRPRCRVALAATGYSEHAHAWQQAGHELIFFSDTPVEPLIYGIDVLVIINPNNPSGKTFSKPQLLKWLSILQKKNGWLIVDEAFIDCTPELSLCDQSYVPGLIVLRSAGKFFGLAGIRSGFVMAENELLMQLQNTLGPWTLNGPGRYLTRLALADSSWQQTARQQLQQSAARLTNMITSHTGTSPSGTALFQTMIHPQAAAIHQAFARRAILTRLLDDESGIRFGLPGADFWARLETAFSEIFKHQQLIA